MLSGIVRDDSVFLHDKLFSEIISPGSSRSLQTAAAASALMALAASSGALALSGDTPGSGSLSP